MKDENGFISLTRPELYEKVWTTPAARLAKEFGFTDVALAKLCKKHNIPKPPVGYWAKLQHGHEMPRTPLPRMDGDDRAIRIQSMSELGVPSEVIKQPDAGIVVSTRLDDPHPLVKQSLTILQNSGIDSDGHCIVGKGSLNVAVTRDLLDRAFRIMDALVKALEYRGCSISITAKNATQVLIAGEPIELRLEEPLDFRERPLTIEEKRAIQRSPWLSHKPEYRQYPSGLLRFSIAVEYGRGLQRTWSETKSRRMENMLNSSILRLWKAAEISKSDRKRVETIRREYEEEKRQREEQKRLQREEEERVEQLSERSESWTEYIRMREFIDEVERSARAATMAGTIEFESPVAVWLAWAKRYVESKNPVVEQLAELSGARLEE